MRFCLRYVWVSNYFFIQLQTIVQNGPWIEDLENDPDLLFQYREERIIDFTPIQTTAVLKCPASAGLYTANRPDGASDAERRLKRRTSTTSRICEPKRIWKQLNLAMSINGSLIQIVQV